MIKKEYLIGVDLGAGSLKASIIDSTGTLISEGSSKVTTFREKFSWSEQDPGEWYKALCYAVKAAIEKSKINKNEIACLGLSAGAHIPVLLDADNNVIRKAIMWDDQRSAIEAEELNKEAGDMILNLSMNKPNPTWALAMLKWIKKNEPENFKKIKKFFIAKDYLRYLITGDWNTDYSDVVGALMADSEKKTWSKDICDLIGLPMNVLPPVKKPFDISGKVKESVASATGMMAGTPVVVGSNDTTVEFFGVGAIKPGNATIKLATAGVLSLGVGEKSICPPISCYPHVLDGMYYVATGMNSCASAHRWLKDQFFSNENDMNTNIFQAMDQMANEAKPGSDGLMFHPYLQGERAPYWDPKLRASFIGMTINHSKKHFVRAFYEGIAFAMMDLLNEAKSKGLSFSDARIIGGGAESKLWRKIICDVTGLTILKPNNGDASFGAAILAGIGSGIFSDPIDAVKQCVKIVDTIQPDQKMHDLYQNLYKIYGDTQKSLQKINHSLHDFFVEQ